jgi:dTDP-4-dehydrorhamnose reductase
VNVLVTGAGGVLGTAVCAELQHLGHRPLKTDVWPDSESNINLDITDADRVEAVFAKCHPDLVLHLAAATDLDFCEKDPEYAHNVNVRGTENIANACSRHKVTLVYVSTGGIFDGTKKEPYVETDAPHPVNVYARTKWEGEKAAQAIVDKLFIFRLCWVIGGGVEDKKFVGKIVGQIRSGVREIRAVSDIWGSPTFARDFSRNVMGVVAKAPFGLYHMVNKGACSRFELAQKIVELMDRKDVIRVVPVNAEAFPMVAPRPRSEVLSNERLRSLGLDSMPSWEDGLREYLSQI